MPRGKPKVRLETPEQAQAASEALTAVIPTVPGRGFKIRTPVEYRGDWHEWYETPNEHLEGMTPKEFEWKRRLDLIAHGSEFSAVQLMKQHHDTHYGRPREVGNAASAVLEALIEKLAQPQKLALNDPSIEGEFEVLE